MFSNATSGELRFASLGSGSRGNATLIEAGDVRLVVDCGFAARELEQRLSLLNVAPDSLDAVLVTHEHGDHIRGVGALARRYGLPVWMTAGTHKADRCGILPQLHLVNSHNGRFSIGDIEVRPFPIPHDAREPCQYSFSYRGRQLTLLTDLGRVTRHVLEHLKNSDALLLECNHDRGMLTSGPYPPRLQARVGGNFGHLSNCQAADLLQQIEHKRLKRLVAAHLSEQNNSPQQVELTLLDRVPELDGRLAIVSQDSVSHWFEC